MPSSERLIVAAAARWALTLLMIGVVCASRADAQVQSYKVEATCPNDQVRRGTGFFARELGLGESSSGGRIYFVTSLHLVHGCSSFAIVLKDCSTDWPSTVALHSVAGQTPVWLLPSHDIAVVPLDEGKLVPALIRNRKHAKRVFHTAADTSRNAQLRPEVDSDISIRGYGQDIDCAAGKGFIGSYTTVNDQMKHLQQNPDLTTVEKQKLQGSLAGDTRIMTYFSSAQPGVSGAPVTAPRSQNVVAIHQASSNRRSVGWGIRPLLRDAPQAGSQPCQVDPNSTPPAPLLFGKLGGCWPPFKRPLWSESSNSETLYDGDLVERVDRARYRLALADVTAGARWTLVGGSADREPDVFDTAGLLVMGSLLLDVTAPEQRDLSATDWAIAIGLGYFAEDTTERTFAPLGLEPLEQRQLQADSLLFQLGVHLRFSRFEELQLGLEAGARVEHTWFDSAPSGADDIGWGFALPLSARVLFVPWTSVLGFMAQAAVVPGWPPSTDFRYTGTALETDRDHGFALSVEATLGVELLL